MTPVCSVQGIAHSIALLALLHVSYTRDSACAGVPKGTTIMEMPAGVRTFPRIHLIMSPVKKYVPCIPVVGT